MRFAALLLIVACSDPEPTGPSVTSHVEYKDIPLFVQPAIDVLIVVDNSPQAAPHRATFSAAAKALGTALETLPIIRTPDLHLGIVTTDLGSRGTDDTTATAHGDCSASGDAGVMVTAASTTSLNYLTDHRRGDGVRELDYAGSLGDALAATVDALPTGCSFPRPLEAIRRSLQNPQNPDFFRPDAFLAVILFTASDDCSFTHQEFLDGADAYRCVDSPNLLVAPADVASFLKNTKSDPFNVMVGGAFGPATPFVDDPQARTVQPSCTIDAAGGQRSAQPGVRLHAFLDQFPNRASETSVCQDDVSASFALLGQLFRVDLAGDPCLEGTPVVVGSKHDCVGSLLPEGFDEILIPECTSADDPAACFRINSDPQNCTFGSGTSIELANFLPTTAPTHEIIQCAVE